jgi:hypothetical protein
MIQYYETFSCSYWRRAWPQRIRKWKVRGLFGGVPWISKHACRLDINIRASRSLLPSARVGKFDLCWSFILAKRRGYT